MSEMEMTENRGANWLSILDQARTDPRISPRFELLSLERMAARIRVKNSLISITELGSFPLAQHLAEVSPAASENFGEVQCKGVRGGLPKDTTRKASIFQPDLWRGPLDESGNICEESGARDLKLVEEFAGGDGACAFREPASACRGFCASNSAFPDDSIVSLVSSKCKHQ
jgi:hypothetical protein